jgi:hypothetical protein
VKRMEYTCDICGQAVHEEHRDFGPRPFVSYGLGIVAHGVPAKDRFMSMEPQDAERHICHLCLAGLVALAARTLPADAMRKATDEV